MVWAGGILGFLERSNTSFEFNFVILLLRTLFVIVFTFDIPFCCYDLIYEKRGERKISIL